MSGLLIQEIRVPKTERKTERIIDDKHCERGYCEKVAADWQEQRETVPIHEIVMDVNEGQPTTILSDRYYTETTIPLGQRIKELLDAGSPTDTLADKQKVRDVLKAAYPAALMSDRMQDLFARTGYQPTPDQVCLGWSLLAEQLDRLGPEECEDVELDFGLLLTDPIDRLQIEWLLLIQTFDAIRVETEALHAQEGQRRDLSTIFSDFFLGILVHIIQGSI